ncbi:MAG: phage major capsid protein [Phycisphaerae bacterium]|nr:phage major capsid protein [Phycisphaerae bacterium]
MTLIAQLKEKREERKKALDAAGAILTKAQTEKRSITTEEEQEFDKRHTDGDRLLKEIERLEKQLDSERSLAATATDTRTSGREDFNGAPEKRSTEITPEKKAKFKEFRSMAMRAWFVAGPDNLVPNLRARYNDLNAEVGDEYRALSATTSNAGAATVPTGFVYQLETALKYFGGIIEAADRIPTETGAPLPYPSINDAGNTADALAENAAVRGSSGGSSEADPTYGVVTFNAYDINTGFVLVPIQLLQDSAFDVDAYLAEQLAIRVGRKLNTLCTTGAGSGSNQPQGFVGVATTGATTASGTAISYNDLLALFHSVDPAYRIGPKVGWMFNDSTLLAIRKLVDTNGRPLFIAGGVSEGIQNAQPDTILGKPYWINQDMATIAVNNKTVAFGDFSKYKIREVRQIGLVKAQERFIDLMQIGFLAYQRFDGNLLDAGTHPLKILVQNAS